jgi:hypothetical protein
MARILDWSAWAMSSLGIALLVIGLVLVPQSGLWADDPEEDPMSPAPCSGDTCCDAGCLISAGCGGSCAGNPFPPPGACLPGTFDCSGCGCAPNSSLACHCYP